MKTIQNFKKEIKRILKKKTPQEVFLKIKESTNLTRVDLMIIDSGIKNLPVEHIPETLLIRQEVFHEMLQNITTTLKTTF